MSGEEVIARRVVVRGEVQGVFFRDSTQRRAGELGVGGWVRNREDGAVELWAEGPSAAVDALLEFAREGPSRADVTSVEVDEAEPEGHGHFDVR